MKANQCHHCYKFCTYKEMDSFTPYGCYNAASPEPYDPTMLCGKCSKERKGKFLEGFKSGDKRNFLILSLCAIPVPE